MTDDDQLSDSPDDRAARAFRDALQRSTDDDLPRSPDLTDVRRRTRRRSALTIVGAAATVLALLGVSFAIADRDEAPDRSPVASDPPNDSTQTPPPDPRDGWRVESFLNAQIQVPDSWVYDAYPASQWCIVPPPTAPYVDRELPPRPTTLVGCAVDGSEEEPTDRWVDHVLFGEAREEAAAHREQRNGWWTVTQPVGTALITVVSRDESLIDEILDTARVIEVDQYGCPVQDPIQGTEFIRPDPAFDLATVQEVDSIAVCRYVIGEFAHTGEPGLTDSHELTGTAAQQELIALQEAPPGGGPDNPDSCMSEYNGDEAIVLWLRTPTGDHRMHVYYNWCFHNGFDDGTTLRALTSAACSPLYGPPVSLHSANASVVFDRCDSI